MSIKETMRERRRHEKETTVMPKTIKNATDDITPEEEAAALAAAEALLAKDEANPFGESNAEFEAMLAAQAETKPSIEFTRLSTAPFLGVLEPLPGDLENPEVARDLGFYLPIDVMLVTGQKGYRAVTVAQAIVDRFRPSLVVGDAAGGRADQMVQAHCNRRGIRFESISPDWGNAELGNSAGPLRNGEVLDLVRRMMIDGKRAVHVFFSRPEDHDPADRAIHTMYGMASERNGIMQQRFPHLVLKMVHADKWLEDELNAANAKSTLGPAYDAEYSDRLMIGNRRLPANPIPVEVARS